MLNKRPQFTLSSLMFAMIIAAIATGWFVTWNQSSNHIGELENRIKDLERTNKELLQQRVLVLQSELASLRGRYTTDHPMVQSKQQELNDTLLALQN